MAITHSKTKRAKSPCVRTIKIPPHIQKLLDETKPTGAGRDRRKWEPWQEKALLEYWKVIPQRKMAIILKIGVDICRRKYKELTAK